jgi:hypothetical protein
MDLKYTRISKGIKLMYAGWWCTVLGDDSGVENLVSVAPTEEKVLLSIQRVFDQYLKD